MRYESKTLCLTHLCTVAVRWLTCCVSGQAEVLMHRKDVNDEEKKADTVIEHCDALQAMSSSAMAVVAAVRWKRKTRKATSQPTSPK